MTRQTARVRKGNYHISKCGYFIFVININTQNQELSPFPLDYNLFVAVVAVKFIFILQVKEKINPQQNIPERNSIFFVSLYFGLTSPF